MLRKTRLYGPCHVIIGFIGIVWINGLLGLKFAQHADLISKQIEVKVALASKGLILRNYCSSYDKSRGRIKSNKEILFYNQLFNKCNSNNIEITNLIRVIKDLIYKCFNDSQ